MEYVDYESLTEAELGAMDNLTVRSKVSELPMSSSGNISPYALGMSVRIDLEKRRRATQTDKERDNMVGKAFLESCGKFGSSDKVVEAAAILRKLDTNCSAMVYREALATRMQLRKMALKNLSGENFAEALLQAHYSLLLAKKFHMDIAKTPLSGEMAMELLILSKCYAHVGQFDAGRTHLIEFRFLVEQTILHLVKPAAAGDRAAPQPTERKAVINCDPKVFPNIVFTLAEILTMYDLHEDAEIFFSKYLMLCEREFGGDSVGLSEAINSVCVYLLRSRQHMKALPLAVKALEIQKKHFGDYTSETPDPRVAEGYCNVGMLYRMVGNPLDALHNLLIAIDMKMRIFQDREHPEVQDIFLSLGCCQHMLGNFHAAASIYREVYTTRCDTLGTTHPLTVAVKHLLEDLDRDIRVAPDPGAGAEKGKSLPESTEKIYARVKALGAEMGHPSKRAPRGAPGIEVCRIQSLYANKTKHFRIPTASILQTHECIIPRKEVIELSRQISIQYAYKRLPIINIPRMARGRLILNDSQPVMECNKDASDLLLEWDFRPPSVTADGDVVGGDPKLSADVLLFIPIMEDGKPVMGFYSKPIFVPNPGLFHAFKRAKTIRDFNVEPSPPTTEGVKRRDSNTTGTLDPTSSGATRDSDPKEPKHTVPLVKVKPLLPPKRGDAVSAPKEGPPKKLAPKGVSKPSIVVAKKLPLKPKGDVAAAAAAAGAEKKTAPPPAIAPKKGLLKGMPKIVQPKIIKTLGSPRPDDAAPPKSSPVPKKEAPKGAISQGEGSKTEDPAPSTLPLVEQRSMRLGDLFSKKLDTNANNRNAKFLAKIGNLAKIMVKPNQVKAPGAGGMAMVKQAAPVTGASPPSSLLDSDADTSLSDLDDEEVFMPSPTLREDPTARASVVAMPPRNDKLPLDLKSIHDPLPMDILSLVRGICSHKDDDTSLRCMLLGENGRPLAIVPWQIDMMSLTLAKSCLSMELLEKYSVATEKKDDSSEASKEAQIAAYRKLLAGEGLHDLGFSDLIGNKAMQSLAGGEDALSSGLGMGLPPSVLANLRKQAEELERKAKEEAEAAAAEKDAAAKAGAAGMPKVVPILKKEAPATKKGAPPMKKGAPKGLAPPGMKKGLPTKSKGKGGPSSMVDNSKVRRFFWDPIFGEDAQGTLFACPKGMPTVEKPEIEATFAKAVPKARVAVVSKPKVLNLLPDSKRAYNMNIGLSKFSKYTFKELKDAVLGLDPAVLNIEATEGLMTLLPTPEEANIVQEYVKSGGDMNLVDRPEQFVAVISTIPLLKQRLDSHHVALTFKEHFQEIITPLERIMDGCEAVMSSIKLNVLSNVILKIGNTLNEGDAKKGNAEGFKPTTFAKLNEFRTTTKPVKTLLQYICDIVAKDDETMLEIYNELRPCEECSKIDTVALEANISKFKNDMQKVNNSIAAVERLRDANDEFVPIMRDFLKDAEPKVSYVQEQQKEVMLMFRETAKYMGYPDKEVEKVRVDELFRHIWGFAKNVEVARKARLEAIEKERRMVMAERRKQEQVAARKSKMRTSLMPTTVTATPKMVDGLADIVKTQT
ncbi:formin homology 2 domain containing protein, putative [Babesia bigemina]|uniref:Formin homology 2 domain containing protein, putative n=1 Tax=Babesia bigemina TaxID=5866 RepID=A0A061D8W9_BABBI|nr:formin homology 2 domain containing protein, putative [Babesia bigemina]CDR95319.1 formin homology 2 domain containing protein, putative [Babesia bigemina]|eukprot:XP_012767505.1 formin homology 2 domain containing protein, putative [Babesia bigemina]